MKKSYIIKTYSIKYKFILIEAKQFHYLFSGRGPVNLFHILNNNIVLPKTLCQKVLCQFLIIKC